MNDYNPKISDLIGLNDENKPAFLEVWIRIGGLTSDFDVFMACRRFNSHEFRTVDGDGFVADMRERDDDRWSLMIDWKFVNISGYIVDYPVLGVSSQPEPR